MTTSMKKLQLEEMKKAGVETDVPCMRCLVLYTRGEFKCTMPPNKRLWANLKGAVRCLHCATQGQDCFAVRIGAGW